jgi:hypothetical protein
MARRSIRGLGADLYSPPSDEHQHTSLPAHQPTSADASLTKATFYLSPEILHDLDRAWLEHRGRERRRVSKSSLVEIALREFLTKPDAP